jgi:hypothetical protein
MTGGRRRIAALDGTTRTGVRVMRRRAPLTPLVATTLALLATPSCTDVTGDDLVVPTLELTATPTAAGVGDEILFRYEAVGNVLSAITIVFDDGEEGTLNLAGARQVEGEVPHIYVEPGSFQVRAILADAAIGSVEASVTVEISPVAPLAPPAPAPRAPRPGRTSPR